MTIPSTAMVSVAVMHRDQTQWGIVHMAGHILCYGQLLHVSIGAVSSN